MHRQPAFGRQLATGSVQEAGGSREPAASSLTFWRSLRSAVAVESVERKSGWQLKHVVAQAAALSADVACGWHDAHMLLLAK